jgi:hypothetical protein
MTALMLSQDRFELIVFWLTNEIAPYPPSHGNSGSGGPSHFAWPKTKQHVVLVQLALSRADVALGRQGLKMAPLGTVGTAQEVPQRSHGQYKIVCTHMDQSVGPSSSGN